MYLNCFYFVVVVAVSRDFIFIFWPHCGAGGILVP